MNSWWFSLLNQMLILNVIKLKFQHLVFYKEKCLNVILGGYAACSIWS